MQRALPDRDQKQIKFVFEVLLFDNIKVRYMLIPGNGEVPPGFDHEWIDYLTKRSFNVYRAGWAYEVDIIGSCKVSMLTAS